jgi:hypothetical protein
MDRTPLSTIGITIPAAGWTNSFEGGIDGGIETWE